MKDAAYYRNYRATKRNTGRGGCATKPQPATETQPSCATTCNRLQLLEDKVALLEQSAKLMEETVAKLAASQAKVSVVPGSTIKRFVGPLSKEAQAAGRMGREVKGY